MDKIDKALKKLDKREKSRIKAILLSIKSNKWNKLDIVKLKGQKNIFRVRVGKYRIIFQTVQNGPNKILALEKRGDQTYNL